MSEIPKAYEPQAVEEKWYRFWLERNFFTADPRSAKPAYSIVIPPPNVTGVLTMGHVLNNTIQDILARLARMKGCEVLWLPGTDHAGIATQNAVETALKKTGEIRHRDDLGREKFLEQVWQWKEKHGGIIIQQLKKLGASCDWTRERFTMDAEYSRCVQKVFVELYRNKRIYRGPRMVNWDPAARTALSDEEVIMKEQKGFLYYFKVQVVETDGSSFKDGNGQYVFLTIATTRPETIPGDNAIAVNPKDTRYQHLIGKCVMRPLPTEVQFPDCLIPIVDDEQVDSEFGTGVLKVTPEHDKADALIYERLCLKQLNQDRPGLFRVKTPVRIMNFDGMMNDSAGRDLSGLDRFEARKRAVDILKGLKLQTSSGENIPVWEDEKPCTHNVGFSERSGVPIETLRSDQWFLIYPKVEEVRNVVAEGRLKFFPERWVKVYNHWLANIQPWCISRQLWWGHRIPVWTNRLNMDSADSRIQEAFRHDRNQSLSGVEGHRTFFDFSGFANNGTVTAATESEFEAKILESLNFVQDSDVLDTWFSSWLWPFATMGWPEKTDTLRKFYPTTDLVTGPDIIFFWVARMIMAGFEFTGQEPFRNVYFTGIIRDKQGRKMSKSLGNSPDPLDLIAKYGADALRFGVMRSAPLGQDILYDEKQVELGRNFCNKLWNACRFRQLQAGQVQGEIQPALLSTDDRWILLRLDAAVRELDAAFAEYRFSEATGTLYRFFWSEYCDWYLEAAKAVLQGSDATRRSNTLAVMDFVLSHALRLFHPFLPFITEELWHGMGYAQDMPDRQGGQTIMFAPWPKVLDEDFKSHYGLSDEVLSRMQARQKLVIEIRNIRAQYKIPANKKLNIVYHAAVDIVPEEKRVIELLAETESIVHCTQYEPAKGEPVVYPGFGGKLCIPLAGLVDAQMEKGRLAKELQKVEAEIQKVEAKLANPNFAGKAPPEVLEEHRKRLADWQAKRGQLRAELEGLD